MTSGSFADDGHQNVFSVHEQRYPADRVHRRQHGDANAALQQFEEMKSTFITLISHELRTPMTVISGYLSLLTKKGLALPAEKREEMLVAAERRAEELRGIISELTAFIDLNERRCPAPVFVPLRSDIDLADLLEQICQRLRPAAAVRGIALERILDAGSLRFRDPVRLQLILEQLWSNAVKFGHEGGFARLEAKVVGELLVVRVSDDGEGIGANARESIYEPFLQQEPLLQRRHSGLGLGLALVRLAVRDLGGTIELESAASRGTTFTICLPLAGPAMPDDAEELRQRLAATEAQARAAIRGLRSLERAGEQHRRDLAQRDEQLQRRAQELTLAYEQEREIRARLQRANAQTVRALAMTVAAREDRIGSHVSQIAALAMALGRRLGLEGADLDRLEMVAALHDLGTIQVPDAVLNKRGRLDVAEWSIMRTHAAAGAALAAQIDFLAPAGAAIRAHHEHFDGSGYPDGLAGAAIPLEARIVAVIDGFDAMTSQRPYKQRMVEAEALNELRRCAGSQFDPAIVEIFCNLLHQSR